MVITHISYSDCLGGAALSAYRLHRGLRSVGVDSRMLVAEKRSPDEIVQVAARGQKMSERLRRRVRLEIIHRDGSRYRNTRAAHLDNFSDDRTPEPDRLPKALPEADLYNL